MSRSHRELGALAEELERTGADRDRIVLVRCAVNFKRAWVDLAEALAGLQQSRAFVRWGFEDLHQYCSSELNIKAATVDKLLLSLSTMRTYAPEALQGRGAPAVVPSMDAIEYFSRAVDRTERAGRDAAEAASASGPSLEAPGDVVDQLRAAVFDEGRSVSELRKQFNPVLHPKSPEEEAEEIVRKTRGAAQKLVELVGNLDFLAEKRVARLQAAIEALVRDLDEHSPPPKRKRAKAESDAAVEAAAMN